MVNGTCQSIPNLPRAELSLILTFGAWVFRDSLSQLLGLNQERNSTEKYEGLEMLSSKEEKW